MCVASICLSPFSNLILHNVHKRLQQVADMFRITRSTNAKTAGNTENVQDAAIGSAICLDAAGRARKRKQKYDTRRRCRENLIVAQVTIWSMCYG